MVTRSCWLPFLGVPFHLPLLCRLCLRAAVSAAVLFASGLSVGPASAQESTVVGRVVDAESEGPIEDVEVRLTGEGGDFTRLTDERGTFLFPRVPAGTYELVLDHLAYGTRSESLRIAGAELVSLELRLAMQPIELEPLIATVRRRFVPAKMVGFYERMEKGLGYFITREDIERRRPLRITHTIGDLPAVRLIQPDWRRGQCLAPVFKGRRRFTILGGLVQCYPDVYVDAIRVNRGSGSAVCLDDFVIPDEVEAVEVYDGPAVLPPEFGGSGSRCGVIVVWTR